MRRAFLTIGILMVSVLALAQTQKGVVKTKGRMVNGKHVAGQGLTGATVSIQGRSAVLSQANGAFSFPIPSKTFMLQGVQKNGYQLVDPDATRKAYQYSPNIFYIVMETPDQQAEDKLAAERKIRRTLQQQLQKREDEIEDLKAQNKLTQEEYRKALQQLYDDQQNNEKLIADMAKEYAEMDYDQMDELNRQISDAILNGELTRADSLLRSKGDIGRRVALLRKAQETETLREAEIAKEQEELAASKEGTKKKLEDLAQDCKNYFERFKLSNQHDSAAYYIELRAELDTTNANWQFDAAVYLQKQNQYRKAQIYNERALQLNQRFAVSNPEVYELSVAKTQNNLAVLYMNTQRFTEAEKMYLSAQETYQRLAASNPEVYESFLATIQNNLAILYYNTQRFTESEKLYLSALETYQRLAASNPEVYELSVAKEQHNLAYLYSFTQRFAEAEKMYLSALETFQRLAASNPEAYESYVAHTQNNLADLYQITQRFTEAEKMYLSALETYQRLAASNPEAYEPDVTHTQNNLAFLYEQTQRFAEAEKIYLLALETRLRLAASNQEAYEWAVAQTLYNMGLLYKNIQRYTKAFHSLYEAMEIYKRLAIKDTSKQKYYEYALSNLRNIYQHFQETGGVPLECKAEVEKIKQLLEEE